MFSKITGLPSTTLRHFDELLKKKDIHQSETILQSLGVIQQTQDKKGKSKYIPTKHHDISLQTSLDQSGSLQFSAVGKMNNFLDSGITGAVSLSTKLKGKQFTSPKLSIGIKLPYYFNNDLHLFEIENGECEIDETFPFKHKEKINSMKLKYSKSDLKISFEQNCHNTTAEANESLRYIPRKIINGTNDMEYLIDVTY